MSWMSIVWAASVERDDRTEVRYWAPWGGGLGDGLGTYVPATAYSSQSGPDGRELAGSPFAAAWLGLGSRPRFPRILPRYLTALS
jgi:hypothetical protein